jgi:TnpA family transposase
MKEYTIDDLEKELQSENCLLEQELNVQIQLKQNIKETKNKKSLFELKRLKAVNKLCKSSEKDRMRRRMLRRLDTQEIIEEQIATLKSLSGDVKDLAVRHFKKYESKLFFN